MRKPSDSGGAGDVDDGATRSGQLGKLRFHTVHDPVEVGLENAVPVIQNLKRCG